MSSPKSVDDSFHNAISPIVKLMQLISIMPMSDIKHNAPNSLKFKWRSARVAYCIAFIAYGAFESILMFITINAEGISAKNIGKEDSVSAYQSWWFIVLFILYLTLSQQLDLSFFPTQQRALSSFYSSPETIQLWWSSGVSRKQSS